MAIKVSNEFIWKGKLFRRMPDTTLFVAFHELVLPCPHGVDHLHPGLGITAVEEGAIDRMIFRETGVMGSA